MTSRAALFSLGVLLAATPMPAAGADDGWSNLARVTRERSYGFVTRDGECYEAEIRSADNQKVTIHSAGTGDLVLPRADVLRVSDFPNALPRDTVYIGRSSWTDLQLSGPRGSEYWVIVTKQGEELRSDHTWGIAKDWVSANGRTIEKLEVESAIYVRYEPLTRWEQNVHRAKMDLLALRIWFRGTFLKKIAVLMYDASLPEDNSPVRCK